MSKHTDTLLDLLQKAKSITCELVNPKEKKVEEIKIKRINAENTFDDHQRVFELGNGKNITVLELEFANEHLTTSSNRIELGNYVFTLF